MKNIVAITLGILALLLVGFLANNLWPKTQDLSVFLRPTFTSSYTMTLIASEERPEPYTVTLGPTEEESASFEVTSTQGQYLDEEGRLALTLLAQKINEEDMALFKEKAWARYQSPSRAGLSEQYSKDGYDVYVSFRDLTGDEDTSTMLTMGSGYVFFPEDNTVITYSMFNPRLYACEDQWNPETCRHDESRALPTMDDNKTISNQIIDHFTK